ncbi:hypothetical protein J437_LFUL001824 [Ladona fulva]|uniref:Uncharacterized protein n=1 Tax=Ladona fulva TaxID=123851 RepID=A0A8K0JYG7_LADFU|nr:hypothetical protein J437_LFUL001824 [Ladona fulva]
MKLWHLFVAIIGFCFGGRTMSASHGGILYYVVKVPRAETSGSTAAGGGRCTPVVHPIKGTISNDSGWDNPFQPDGDLSREADEIVELIKGGKPITPTPGSVAPPIPSTGDTTDGIPSTPPGVHNATTEKSAVSQVNSVKPADGLKPPSSPKEGTGANGNAAPATVAPNKGAPSSVEVQRGHVPPGDACQAEHVVLKKKPKCKCCSIQ